MPTLTAIAALASITLAPNGPGNTIIYPSALLLGGYPESRHIPYPGLGRDSDTGELLGDFKWKEGRITSQLGVSMYGSLDAILQRRIFPYWYCWGEAQTKMTLDDLPTADFTEPPSGGSSLERYKQFNPLTSPLFFDPLRCFSFSPISYYQTADLTATPPLGDYTFATNRDFSAAGTRIWTANRVVDDAMRGDKIGLSVSLDEAGSYAAHYWMDPESLTSTRIFTTDFTTDPLGSADWRDGYFRFVGDYNTIGWLPDGTFTRLGYAEIRDNIHPDWAVKYYKAKGFDSLDDIFGADAQSNGDRVSDFFEWLPSSGTGRMVDASIVQGAYLTDAPRRIVVDHAAVDNIAASVCKVAFLGTKKATTAQLSTTSIVNPTFHTEPHADLRYVSRVYEGAASVTKTNSVTLRLQGGLSANNTWNARPEGTSWSEIIGEMFADGGAELRGSVTSETTVTNSAIAVGWHDTSATANFTGLASFPVFIKDVKAPAYVYTWTNPFYGEDAAAQGKWVIQQSAWADDTGFFISLWLYAGKIYNEDGTWEYDPKSVFSNGNCYAPLYEGYLDIPDGATNEVDMTFTLKQDFKGREFVDVAPFEGPTGRETPLASYKGGSILPVTYNTRLYEAGIVKTALGAYTTVGISGCDGAGGAAADSGVFSFSDDEEELSLTSIYTKLTAPPSLKDGNGDAQFAKSVVGWQGKWKAFVSKADVDSEIDARREHFITTDAWTDARRLHMFKPTRDAAENGFSGESEALRAWLSNLKAAFSTLTTNELSNVDFDYSPIEDIPYNPDTSSPITHMDQLLNDQIRGGRIGTVTLTINFTPSNESLETLKRSSIGAGYEKKGLPMAYWNFPAMNSTEWDAQ